MLRFIYSYSKGNLSNKNNDTIIIIIIIEKWLLDLAALEERRKRGSLSKLGQERMSHKASPGRSENSPSSYEHLKQQGKQALMPSGQHAVKGAERNLSSRFDLKQNSSAAMVLGQQDMMQLMVQQQQCTCQICCEIMKSEAGRAPIEANPCGHKFCKACLESRCEQSCLMCGSMINDWKVDQALMQAVSDFLFSREQRFKPRLGNQKTHDICNMTKSDYSDKLSSLSTRISIMKHELGEKEKCKHECDAQVSGFRRAQEALVAEEQTAKDKVERAKRHLLLVQTHIQEQRDNESRVQHQSDQYKDIISMTKQSLVQLEQEYDKTSILLGAVDSN